jgi:hypothetical protein
VHLSPIPRLPDSGIVFALQATQNLPAVPGGVLLDGQAVIFRTKDVTYLLHVSDSVSGLSPRRTYYYALMLQGRRQTLWVPKTLHTSCDLLILAE